MPRMPFVDSLACVDLFLQCISPGFISQELTVLEHSLEGFPQLGITTCVCCMPVATCLYFLHVSTCGGQGWVHIGMCIYAACTHL